MSHVQGAVQPTQFEIRCRTESTQRKTVSGPAGGDDQAVWEPEWHCLLLFKERNGGTERKFEVDSVLNKLIIEKS